MALADLGRCLWSARLLAMELSRERAAIVVARAAVADPLPLRRRRDRLRATLVHGAHGGAGAWLDEVESAARRHRLAMLAVDPIAGESGMRAVPSGFVRRAAEVRLRGDWFALAAWVRDLSHVPGTVTVERIALEPARDLHDRSLDARVVIAFYLPADLQRRS